MFYYHLVMKEDTKMPRKGISPVSALELAMSCSRCPDPHLPGCGGNWLVLNSVFVLSGHQHPILGEVVRKISHLLPQFSFPGRKANFFCQQ